MKGSKYAVAMTQIAASLKDSKHAMAMAQMSVKLMSPGVHRQADIVGMIMAQLSMKAAIKKWGDEAKFAISKEMKQLHWRNLYKPRHWHALSKKQKEQVLESHIYRLDWAKKVSLAAICLVAGSASFGLREN